MLQSSPAPPVGGCAQGQRLHWAAFQSACSAAISPVERCRLQKSGNEELKLRLEEAVGRQVGGKGGMNGGMVETHTAGGVFSFEPPPPL